MSNYNNILDKLQEFVRKHYTQKLLKGILLFLTFGLLFLLAVLGIEYFLWLGSTGRLLLLLVFIATEFYLLFAYILTPLFYLFKLKQGITTKDAAVLIGNHFPEVGDKLYNLLDLADNPESSELLIASIDQRSEQLQPVPFSKAVDYKDALPYAKYFIFPVLIALLVWMSGQWHSFFGSYNRVVNYDIAYEQPAPFRFELLSNQLSTLKTEPFTIKVKTIGHVQPENVFLVLDGKELLLQKQNDSYQYTLTPPINSQSFSFEADQVKSKRYTLDVINPPSILDFSLSLTYPSYLNKPNEVLQSTGNAIIPEGTSVTWRINSEHTDKIALVTRDDTTAFEQTKHLFSLQQRIYNSLNYQITTSNSHVSDFESLDYNFSVVKDAYPKISVAQIMDSIAPNVSYYTGDATDDYGVAAVSLVYYPTNNPEAEQQIAIIKGNSTYAPFYYTFPSGLALQDNINYEFYFLVTDNDGVNKGKATKSQVFNHSLLNTNELKNKDLESQNKLIEGLDKSLELAKQQKTALQELSTKQKEKNSLNYDDKSQIKDFLQKQELQEQQMQKFSKALKENLNKSDENDTQKQLLQERLERQEIEARKNEKLIEELNKIADKIDKEELTKKLEELGKKQQNSQRSLEQLVELTKRYYVTEKAAQLSKALEELAKKQEELAETSLTQDSQNAQKELNTKFDTIAKELEELQKDNANLKKPLSLDIQKSDSDAVKANQQNALDNIKKQELEDQKKASDAAKSAKQNQKSAAEKMKEMSEQLSASSSSSAGSSVAEDAEVLRQILDNLIVFSFKQEGLYDKLSTQNPNDVSQYGATVRGQNELRSLFEHVDDSLFSLSLRQAELSEVVNEQVTEVYYNIDKSLERMADGQMYQGVSYQKYVLNAANTLADVLADILENMNESMQPGKGEGGGDQDFQLPDIIKGQQSLGEQMGEKGSEGKSGSEGEKGQQGSKGKSGENGNEGNEGKSGENGKSGKDGQGGKNGQGGSQGQNGTGEGNGEGKSGENGDAGGDNGKGNRSGGTGMSEAELKEIYEIYQQQQRIREELEQQLDNLIQNGDRKLGAKIIRQMEDFENDLLENGITQRTISKANTIQYELLKLENAALKQGEKQERESNTNTNQFVNPITTKPSQLDNYRNEVEILNRQALPLRLNYQNKVKTYFKTND